MMGKLKEWKGVFALVGCFITNMISGTVNTWGAVSIYFTSYFHSKDSSVTSSSMYLCFMISYLLGTPFFMFASYLSSKIGCKYTVLLGSWTSGIFMLTSSFTTNHYLFCVLYGIYGAEVTGIINIPIIWACWGFYPQRIGMVTSLGLAGYSLGPMVFGFLWTMMINPHNDSPHKSHDGNADSGLFGHEVYDKVPASIRWAALIYVIIATCGTSLIWNKGLTDGRKGAGQSLKLKDVAKQKNFWLLLGWGLFLFSPYAFTFTNYKVVAISKIKNDHFFAYLGSAGFLSACLARLGCGFLVDKYGWKRLALISASIQTIINAAIYYAIEIEEIYAILVIIEFICGSNAYLLLVMACREIYSKDTWVISYTGSGITIAVFLIYLMQLFISPFIGYEFTFDILAGMAFISFILVYLTKRPTVNDQTDISLLSAEPSLTETKTEVENSIEPKTLS